MSASLAAALDRLVKQTVAHFEMADAKLRHAIAFEAARLMYERTESEYRELLRAGGFRLTRIVPTRSSTSVVEGIAT